MNRNSCSNNYSTGCPNLNCSHLDILDQAAPIRAPYPKQGKAWASNYVCYIKIQQRIIESPIKPFSAGSNKATMRPNIDRPNIIRIKVLDHTLTCSIVRRSGHYSLKLIPNKIIGSKSTFRGRKLGIGRQLRGRYIRSTGSWCNPHSYTHKSYTTTIAASLHPQKPTTKATKMSIHKSNQDVICHTFKLQVCRGCK
jgi:hypothetical protein